MCGITDLRCVLCGEAVEMHLGDFETLPEEIEIVCDSCLRKIGESIKREKVKESDGWRLWLDKLHKLFKKPYVLWVYCEEANWTELKLCLVHSKTENAWENREVNHPNKFVCSILEVVHD